MKKQLLNGILLMGSVALISLSFICGEKQKKVTIYHMNGEGNWVVITVKKSALSAHAAHGDLYFSTFCPLTGAENACR